MWRSVDPRRLRARPGAIGVHDATAFRTASARAGILRLVTAGAAVGLVVAALAQARDLDARPPGLVPSGTTAVAVVDLSLSIEDAQYRLVDGAFRRLIEENASIGLVVFSDLAYELLPPGTPASELRPILRLLVPPRAGEPVNPWTGAFRSGTRVSTALQLARSMLERNRIDSGSILLVSDLETAPDDVPALTRTVASLRRGRTELRVVGLSPSSDAQLIFRGLFQDEVFDPTPDRGEAAGRRSGTAAPFPTTLVVLAALALLALAAAEYLGGSLAIPAGARLSREAER